MKDNLAITSKRIMAFAVDWLVVALWGGLLFGAVMLFSGGRPRQPGNPWIAEGLGFLLMTLPVTVYFAFCESSPWRATIGKRVLALRVSDRSGDPLSFGTALLRNAIKFVPWECGHNLAHQAAYGWEGEFPAWLWGPAVVAAAGPLWWIGGLLAGGRTPYDIWTGTRVERKG